MAWSPRPTARQAEAPRLNAQVQEHSSKVSNTPILTADAPCHNETIGQARLKREDPIVLGANHIVTADSRPPQLTRLGRSPCVGVHDDQLSAALAPSKAQHAANRRVVLSRVGRGRVEPTERHGRRAQIPCACEHVAIPPTLTDFRVTAAHVVANPLGPHKLIGRQLLDAPHLLGPIAFGYVLVRRFEHELFGAADTPVQRAAIDPEAPSCSAHVSASRLERLE
jgi:hypothetical protein